VPLRELTPRRPVAFWRILMPLATYTLSRLESFTIRISIPGIAAILPKDGDI
jgi:hypothetical protein